MFGITNRLEQAGHAARKGDMGTVVHIRKEVRSFHLQQAEKLFTTHDHRLGSFVRTMDQTLEQFFDPMVDRIARSRTFRKNGWDVLSSLGERLSVPLVGGYLSTMGVDTVDVYTDNLILLDESGTTNLLQHVESTRRLQTCLLPILESGKIPILSGYLAGGKDGPTTLGHGGSDLTSTIVASALGAESVDLWKVEAEKDERGFMRQWSRRSEQVKWTGIRSGDPSLVPKSRVVKSLSYAEAAELAHFGRKVLHPLTMVPLLEQGKIVLNIRNTDRPTHLGTAVGPGTGGGCVLTILSLSRYRAIHPTKIVNLQLDTDPTIISLVGLGAHHSPSLFVQIQQLLQEHNIEPAVPVTHQWSRLFGTDQSLCILVQQTDVPITLFLLHATFVG